MALDEGWVNKKLNPKKMISRTVNHDKSLVILTKFMDSLNFFGRLFLKHPVTRFLAVEGVHSHSSAASPLALLPLGSCQWSWRRPVHGMNLSRKWMLQICKGRNSADIVKHIEK
jgi:hypothetical protein